MPYLFKTPTVDETPAAYDAINIRYKIARGITVVKTGSSYTQVRFPASEDLWAADAYYVGGYEYVVSDAEAASLTSAGYGANLTPL